MSLDPFPAISYRPDLPDWGVYLNWPAESDAWIHPDDISLARRLIPSQRVFRRSRWDGTYYHLHYGQTRLRVLPSLWLRVADVDLEVEQQVELLNRNGSNDAGIFRIADIRFSPENGEIQFYLRRRSLRMNRKFLRRDLRPLYVRHHLRSGYYSHPTPKSLIPPEVELLNVGNLTEP